MDAATQDKLLTLMREGRGRVESTDWFRVGLGLVYLGDLMTQENIDFKVLDRAFNRFIYHTLGPGHTITSVLQFMSGDKVMKTVDEPRFIEAFRRIFPAVPHESIAFLLELNLGVAKNISGLGPEGRLADWIARSKAQAESAPASSAPEVGPERGPEPGLEPGSPG